jgi:hypothetical protein
MRFFVAARIEPVWRALGVLRNALAFGQVFGLQRGRAERLLASAVVDHLELEARGAADDVLDFPKARLVGAGHLDDDVLVARRDRRLAQSELVDPSRDRILRLRDGTLANLGLDIRANLERDLAFARTLRLGQLAEELFRETIVDLRFVVLVFELQANERGLRLRHAHFVLELCQLFACDARLARVETEARCQLLSHFVGEVVALVADRLVDFDRVNEAHSAAQIEARGNRERDPVSDVFRQRDLATAKVVHRRPEGHQGAQEDRDDEAELEPPRAVHRGNEAKRRPAQDER